MEISYLKRVIADLEERRVNLFLAEKTIDKRRRDKLVRKAKQEIADYAHDLSNEVKGFLYNHVDVNALNYQWVEGDINRCIKALKEWVLLIEQKNELNNISR